MRNHAFFNSLTYRLLQSFRLFKLNLAKHVHAVTITSAMSEEEIIEIVVQAFENLVGDDENPVLSPEPNWELLHVASMGQGKRGLVKPAGLSITFENCLR